ncbi:hypothetical protein [Spiroplasma endosymbiont of Nebria brevicollis]|uniref:hypothetical protein n=1 Tax=Spiroplasma endosymbiont of Nebria brevicollis TaxID=3066284 RepID=UPI00313AEA7D
MFNIYGKQNVLNIVKKIELSNENIEWLGSAHFPGDFSGWDKKIKLYYSVAEEYKIDKIVWTIVHEYGHMLDFFVTKNWNISAEEQMIDVFALPLGITKSEYKRILAYGIVRSTYGRTSNKELFAEAFAQWILTPEKYRDLAWEKLDNFFRDNLPKNKVFL